MATKQKTSITLSPEAIRLLGLLSVKLGLSKAAAIELAIRKLSQQEKV